MRKRKHPKAGRPPVPEENRNKPLSVSLPPDLYELALGLPDRSKFFVRIFRQEIARINKAHGVEKSLAETEKFTRKIERTLNRKRSGKPL